MYFQQIYRFEVDLLKKIAMSLPPEQSRPREISVCRYEFGWGASPDVAISKGPMKHNYTTTTISPSLIATSEKAYSMINILTIEIHMPAIPIACLL